MQVNTVPSNNFDRASDKRAANAVVSRLNGFQSVQYGCCMLIVLLILTMLPDRGAAVDLHSTDTLLKATFTDLDKSIGVSLSSNTPRFVVDEFEVVVRFSEPVMSMDADNLHIANGEIKQIYGNGEIFIVWIRPISEGLVMVQVPGRSVVSSSGTSTNLASGPLFRVFNGALADPQVSWIKTWDRHAVTVATEAEFGRVLPQSGSTADIRACYAGSTSDEFRASVAQRANWYRRMAGLEPLVEVAEQSTIAQHGALVLAAEGTLTHHPPPTASCYSDTAASGAAGSSIACCGSSASVVDLYIADPGQHNLPVGHRRDILDREASTIGIGQVGGFNALRTGSTDGHLPGLREPRKFVAWPSSGFFPASRVPGRWSFELQSLSNVSPVDVSLAHVSVRDDKGPLVVRIIYSNYRAIVWSVYDSQPSSDQKNRCLVVSIAGLRVYDQRQPDYEYPVCLI